MVDNSDSLGDLFQALADPTRRAVVQRLVVGAASTKELAQPFEMALPSFMQHLMVLEISGLITSEKVGRVRTWQIQRQRLVAVETWMAEQRKLWEDRTDRLADFAEVLKQMEDNNPMSSHDFIVSRLINAPRRIIWQAWTAPDLLEKWWCPKPITCKVVAFDPRPGGSFDLSMGASNGESMAQTGAFLEVVPQERLVFTTALTKEWRPATSPLPITAFISMTDEGGHTRYVTRVLYKNEEERRKLGDMRFEAGWSAATDQLEELLTTLM